MSNGNIKFLGTIIILLAAMFGYEKYEAISKENQYLKQISEGSQKLRDFNSKGDLQPADLSKQTENNVEEEKPVLQNSNANTRDPTLIGTWSKFSKHTRNSMNSEENWIFNSDGTMAILSHSYAIINDNFEGNIDNGWVENAGVKAEKEAGYRWFTKDNQVFYKAPDGSEILLFYYSIEHYNGKINMFTRQNPNQEKVSASLTKIN